MHVISRKKLKEFYGGDSKAEKIFDNWYRKMKQINPTNLVELHQTFPQADLIGKCVVFDVGGNNYRVITKIYFEQQTVLIRFVLTHAEYDKNLWKTDC
jgi:mRNA interferase HigB